MKHHKYGKSSLEKLSKLHPDLVRVMHLALEKSKYDIGISETLRTPERQIEMVESGKSQTMNSRHLANEDGLSEAVDFFGYKDGPTWDEKVLRKIAGAIFDAAFELGVHIKWGGHWESLLDMPHIELVNER